MKKLLSMLTILAVSFVMTGFTSVQAATGIGTYTKNAVKSTGNNIKNTAT